MVSWSELWLVHYSRSKFTYSQIVKSPSTCNHKFLSLHQLVTRIQISKIVNLFPRSSSRLHCLFLSLQKDCHHLEQHQLLAKGFFCFCFGWVFLTGFSFTDTDDSQCSREREGTIFYSTLPLSPAHKHNIDLSLCF